jgi:hypothetical protein
MSQRNKPSRKQAQRKATSTAELLIDYRADLLNLGKACKLKLPYLT